MKRGQSFSATHGSRRVLRAFGVLLSAAAALPVWALDFDQAYRAASENDATIRAARSAADAGRERLPQARAQLLPNVSLSAGRTHNDLTSETRNFLGQPVTTRSQYYSGSQALSVRQPIYRPLINASVRQAQAQLEDAEAALERDEQALVTRVAEAYFDALLARDQLSLVSAQKKTYTTQVDAARKGFAAGSGTRTDVDEAQARLDLTLAQELEAQQNVEFTHRRLAVITGSEVDALAVLDVARFSPSAPVPASLDAWVERAERASPELASLRAQVEAARLEIEKAQTGHKPTLDLVAQWSRTNSDSVTSVNSRYDNKTIGLQLSVPLYSGGYVSSTVRQAVAAHDRARELLEAARRDLGVRVHREFRGVTEGVLRVAALEQAVRSADQALLSNQKSFKAGMRTSLDVLNAEQQRILALRDLAQARYVYMLSSLRLESLAGEDRQSIVTKVNGWLMP